MHNYINKRLRITKAVFTVSGNWKEQFERPLVLNADTSILGKLEETLHQNRGLDISNTQLAAISPDICTISDTPYRSASIINGWSCRRLRFVIVVESEESNGMYVTFLQGFTDNYDPSLSGRLDPSMSLQINSVTNILRTYNPVNKVFNTFHLSSFNVFQELGMVNDVKTLMRPVDIINGCRNNEMFDPEDMGSITDLTNTVNLSGKTSSRADSIGVNHISKIINQTKTSKSMTDAGHGKSDLLTSMSGMLSQNQISQVPFFITAANVTGDPIPTAISIAALEAIDPNVSNVSTVISNTGARKIGNTFMDGNTSENLGLTNIETSIAVNLSEMLSGIMTENLLTNVAFTFTNCIGGEGLFVPVDVGSFLPKDMDISKFISNFINNFKALMTMVITRNGQVMVDLEVIADLFGETIINISVNGMEHVRYVIPTCADSIYTGVVGDLVSYDNFVNNSTELIDVARYMN